mmetsp:Transcript_35220/g.56969  ORF Transcript_35220/g.56969 Transcript_35220/m.56969 type:complete len:92 (+) Transcript_35220:81-356(+)|eukprot:CAMPEP_0184648394 /NCGR_PEP_ID=MMETSP0308-20130426/5508_1 /TAXON_ID=38269 /ORGANISM="Gloeochaete witrockiana, Strain SAG 46.84" /LENGTH=91 /DNA_ID=CAMNT_0027080185 /DNA_START=66 /DNA_END=341 /DNA_ORIENTATION=+
MAAKYVDIAKKTTETLVVSLKPFLSELASGWDIALARKQATELQEFVKTGAWKELTVKEVADALPSVIYVAGSFALGEVLARGDLLGYKLK